MKRVTLYSTLTNPYYGMAKEFLNEKQILFDVVTVDSSDEIEKITGQEGSLQLVVKNEDGEVLDTICGFDRERLMENLGINII